MSDEQGFYSDICQENAKLKDRVSALLAALHDIFEHASNQKSNRGCATDEGLISTAMASVRVIRRVCDERKSTLTHYESALKEARVALEKCRFDNCESDQFREKALESVNKVLGEKE